MGWGLYIFSIGVMHRVSFEIETVAYLLSGIGIQLLSAYDIQGVTTQIAAMLLGTLLFCFMIWFMGDMDRVAKCRLWIGLGAIGLGPDAADRHQRGGLYQLDSHWAPQRAALGVCENRLYLCRHLHLGPLADQKEHRRVLDFYRRLHRPAGPDAGLRHGADPVRHLPHHRLYAFRQRAHHRLVLAGAVLAVLVVLTVKPYVLDRFMGWGHVWRMLTAWATSRPGC